MAQNREMPERFTNDIGMTFVLIPAGAFWMGSPESDEVAEENEKPQHLVTISQPFYLSIHPVTQGQWEAVMGNNIQLFLDRLSAADGHRTYTLPTEAQWEYACRAGSTTAYCFGEDISQLGEYAWYAANAERRTHRVGQKRPNRWGLYDMHGNVWECCQDGIRKYTSDAVTDPIGPDVGVFRASRGGSWAHPAEHVRCAYRIWNVPGFRHISTGFRCASPTTS